MHIQEKCELFQCMKTCDPSQLGQIYCKRIGRGHPQIRLDWTMTSERSLNTCLLAEIDFFFTWVVCTNAY